MLLPALLLPLFALAAQGQTSQANTITVTAHAGPPFISPMGETFRALRPGEDTLADWFSQADRNQDGVLTVDEMQADAERFFATLDSNHDGEIDPDELVRYEWQVAPEIQVNSRFRRARAASNGALPKEGEHRRGSEGRQQSDGEGDATSHGKAGRGIDDGPQGAARYALLNIPEPVAAADANLDRAISQGEFRQAAVERFRLLDSKRQGKLSLQDLEALRPAEPLPGRRAKHRDDAADTRYGVPLPPAD